TILSDGQKDEIIRHVVQHRMALIDSENHSQIRIAKGTLAPKNLDNLPWNQEKADSSGIDIIIPLSSFKGQKPKVGYYEIDTWIGAKSISQNGKSRTGELNLTEDTLPTLTTRALELVELAKDPRKLAADFIKTYEKQALIRREATVQSDSEESPITLEEVEEAALESMYEMIGQDETITDEMASLLEKETQQEMLIYKALKTAQENNTLEQIVENGYIANKLNDYIRKQKIDIVSGGAIKWNRAIIIPSKDLNDDQICVPGLPMGEDIINFRSPCLLRTDVAIQTNTQTDDILDPKGRPLVGVFAVSDEPLDKYVERRTQEIKAGINPEIGIRNNTLEKKAGQDYDGDTKAAALAKNYPSYVAYLRQMQLPENDYAPVKKEEKLSFGNAT
ncbi:hypothetical protein NG798_27835, partial [Ancylothrix sp. C2]|uniref:hypothetical protein n=1 Tax=Ancylothrix sp. D3o TaxID=2953691 RepID=UPI0021BB449E